MEDPQHSVFISMTVFVGLIVAFVHGWTAIALHTGLRLVLAATTRTPLGLVVHLDRATDRGLLRRLGGGWMFQHRTLLDHFARDRARD